MDMTEFTAPKSDQVNAEDFLGSPRTFTITDVSRGSSEQPVNVKLAETNRYYRPSKSMRRVLVALWGKDSSAYVGKKLTLYCDPKVKFGGKEVGGVKISHASHIDKPMSVALTVTRGQRAPHTVQPLPADAPTSTEPLPPTADDVQACESIDDLRAMYSQAGPQIQQLILARVNDLQGGEQA